jgi:hypothetical protein
MAKLEIFDSWQDKRMSRIGQVTRRRRCSVNRTGRTGCKTSSIVSRTRSMIRIGCIRGRIGYKMSRIGYWMGKIFSRMSRTGSRTSKTGSRISRIGYRTCRMGGRNRV